jgi:hypothetical protein
MLYFSMPHQATIVVVGGHQPHQAGVSCVAEHQALGGAGWELHHEAPAVATGCHVAADCSLLPESMAGSNSR